MNSDYVLFGVKENRNMIANSQTNFLKTAYEDLTNFLYNASSSNDNILQQGWDLIEEPHAALDFLQSHFSVSDTPSLSPQTISFDLPADRIKPRHRTYCIKCKKHLNRSQDLKRHTLIHTGIRGFRCVPCGGAFSRKDALKRHQKTCASCSKS